MKKQIAVMAALLSFSMMCHSQTRRIAHRSHAGSMPTFSVTGRDQFGLGPRNCARPDSIRLDTTGKMILPPNPSKGQQPLPKSTSVRGQEQHQKTTGRKPGKK